MNEMSTTMIRLFGPAELYLDDHFIAQRDSFQRQLRVSIRLSRLERDGQVIWSGDVVPDRPLALASDTDPQRLLVTLYEQTLGRLRELGQRREV
jgi:hypothetical protein